MHALPRPGGNVGSERTLIQPIARGIGVATVLATKEAIMKEISEELDQVIGGAGGAAPAAPRPGVQARPGEIRITPDLLRQANSGSLDALKAIMNAGKAAGFGPLQ